MIIIVDGYNVLKQAFHSVDISRNTKNQFIRQLAHYAKKKGHGIFVVFDGQDDQYAQRYKVENVTVVHSGYDESADDWIKRYLQQRKGFELLLVSTDRALGIVAHKAGVTSIDAMDFYGLLQSFYADSDTLSKGKAVAVKTSEHELPELDMLMSQLVGAVPSKIDDMVTKPSSRESAKRTVSKKERDIVKKLKKL